MTFIDRVENAICATGSILVAGVDPDLEQIPDTFIDSASKATNCNEDLITHVISSFYLSVLKDIHTQITAVKPNLAFFERYGIGGLRAYQTITAWCRDHSLLVIADAKRGDIGSTATAYAQAFLARQSFRTQPITGFEADALTVNPFLGFDTLEPFVNLAVQNGKGLFILARTSNPGSHDLQSVVTSHGEASRGTISSKIADWIEHQADCLLGKNGLSGMGAVVGATRPEELSLLRRHMPRSLFLIPGFGAQGGKVSDIALGLTTDRRGILVNSSRGIFGNIPREADESEVVSIVSERVKKANLDLQPAGQTPDHE